MGSVVYLADNKTARLIDGPLHAGLGQPGELEVSSYANSVA